MIKIKILIRRGKRLLKQCDKYLKNVSELNSDICRLGQNIVTNGDNCGAFKFWDNDTDDIWNTV